MEHLLSLLSWLRRAKFRKNGPLKPLFDEGSHIVDDMIEIILHRLTCFSFQQRILSELAWDRQELLDREKGHCYWCFQPHLEDAVIKDKEIEKRLGFLSILTMMLMLLLWVNVGWELEKPAWCGSWIPAAVEESLQKVSSVTDSLEQQESWGLGHSLADFGSASDLMYLWQERLPRDRCIWLVLLIWLVAMPMSMLVIELKSPIDNGEDVNAKVVSLDSWKRAMSRSPDEAAHEKRSIPPIDETSLQYG